MVTTKTSLSDEEGGLEQMKDKEGRMKQMKDKEGWVEPMKDESDVCSYWEAGKSYLGRSTFHGLSWISEDLPKTIKVSTTLSSHHSFHFTY